MLQILRDLLVRCAKGAELASFAVHFKSAGFTPSLLVMGADSVNFM